MIASIWLPLTISAIGVLCFGLAIYSWCRADEVRDVCYGTGKPVEPGWKYLRWVLLLVGVVLFLWGVSLYPGRKSERQIVQEKVNACLQSGGTPIVTDSGTHMSTHPYFWGCQK